MTDYHPPTGPDPSAIWDVLVDECGARPDQRDEFLHLWPCEFRFMGSLGFGGKVYDERPPRVACYPEDRTPERDAAIQRANDRLAAIADDGTIEVLVEGP